MVECRKTKSMKNYVVTLTLLMASFAIQPGFAQTAPTPDGAIDRLVAVLPDRDRLDNATPRPVNPATVTQLNSLNPGREAEVMALLQATEVCLVPVFRQALRRSARLVIAGLGGHDVERMIAFYQGPDFRILETINARIRAGAQLSNLQRREFTRILAAYPVRQFTAAMHDENVLQAAMMQDDAFLAGITRCAMARNEAFEQHGLRVPE